MSDEGHPALDTHKGEFFRQIVASLERTGNGTCVIRGYRDYPDHIGEDIDIVVGHPAWIPHTISLDNTATVVRIFEHETTNYHLCRWEAGKPVFINLDVVEDYGYRGRLFFRGEEFLKTSRPFKFFRIPSAELEFASYLFRRLAQGSLSGVQARRLSGLYGEDPEGVVRRLNGFLPEAEVTFISEAARSGDWEPVRIHIKDLRRVLLRKLDREQPLARLRYWTGALGRRVKRIIRPPGLMVAFLGTDGSGKSTIMARVEQDLGAAFWDRKQYHKRPLSSPFRWVKRYGLRPPRSGKREGELSLGFNPHALPPRRPLYSLAKLGFWWADFVLLGYVLEIYPKLTRPSLLMFDRYYQDLLVDPKRYHYGGPMRLAHLVGRFIPQPHLVILLDAPPEVLLARKQELPLEEAIRQREAFLDLVQALPNGHVVDTSRPLDEAAEEVERIILGYMETRTALRSDE